MIGRNILILMTILLLSGISVQAFVLYDQAVDVKYNNVEVTSGNLTVLIYRLSTGGTPILNQTFTNKIVNGSWDIYFDIYNVKDGETLYKDYRINNNNIDFQNISGSTINRLPFTISYGETANYTTYYNKTESDSRFWNINGDTGISGNYVGSFNLILNNGYINSNYLQLNTTYIDGHNTGRIQWNIDDGTPEVGMPGGNVNQQIGMELLIRARNVESFTIPNGRIVYQAGTTGTNPQIKLANNNNVTQTMRIVGMTTEDITQWGYVTTLGKVHDVDTRAFSNGDILWLLTNGTYTNIRPTAPSGQYVIGSVTHSNINGTIYVKLVPILRMQYLSDVYCPSIINNSILQWDSTYSRFKCTVNPNFNNVTALNFKGNWNGSVNFFTKFLYWQNATQSFLRLTDQRYNETNKINSINSSLNNNYYTKTQINSNFSKYDNYTKTRLNDTRLNTKITEVNGTVFDRYSVTKEPTGFAESGTFTSNLYFNDTSREFKINGTLYYIYWHGKKIAKSGTDTVTIPSTAGVMNYIYFNSSGALKTSTSAWNNDFYNVIQVATVFYNGTNGLIGKERHGLEMDGMTHYYLHRTVGTRYMTGLTGTFTNPASWSISLGAIADEDNIDDISVQSTTRIFYHTSTGKFTFSPVQIHLYKNVSNIIQYDTLTGTADVPANNYVAYWVLAGVDKTTPIYVIMGQRTDSNLANAKANNLWESMSLSNFDFPEYKLLYRVILRRNGILVPSEIDVQDLRSVNNLPSGTYTATAHGVLSGLLNDDHTQYLLVNGARNMTGNLLTLKNITANTFKGNWNGSSNYYTKLQINNNFSKYNNKSTDLTLDKSLWQNRTDWTTHDNYPTACSGGTPYVSAIGDTLTCIAGVSGAVPYQSSAGGWTNTSTLTSTTKNVKTTLVMNATTFNGAWNYSINYFTKSLYWTNLTSSVFKKSEVTSKFVNRSLWTSIDNYPTACGTGLYVTQIGDTLTCTAIPYQSSASGWTNTTTTTTTAKLIATSKNITASATKFCINNTYAMTCYGSD